MAEKYMKKPIIIEAMQLTDKTKNDVLVWVSSKKYSDFSGSKPKIIIQTLEGEMTVSLWDYVIKGINGEFYPCKPDIFEATYEKS